MTRGNQSWFAGKWTMEIGDFSKTPLISTGVSIAMFDYQRVSKPIFKD